MPPYVLQQAHPPSTPSSRQTNDAPSGKARAMQHAPRSTMSKPRNTTTNPSTAAASSSSGRQGLGKEHQPDRVSHYRIREEIGKGSFAVVYRGEDLNASPPTPVAIKSVIRSMLTAKLLENLESEISLLKGIKQRNVVELLDCVKTDAHIYLVMAFCSAGDLSQYIRKRGQVPGLSISQASVAERFPHPTDGGLNEMVVRCFLGQLAEALKFLRDRNIIHRDIKPQNLLLHPASASDIAAGHPPGIPLLQVADFGFARLLPSQSMAETLCGSPLYMAPEILRYERYDAKADLWSVGAVAYEMATGRPPFRAQNHVELLRRIERGEDRIRFPDEKNSPPAAATTWTEGDASAGAGVTRVSQDVKELIRALLKRNPVNRISFDEFFRLADRVARWGEGSIAPGSIELSNPSRLAGSGSGNESSSQAARDAKHKDALPPRQTGSPRPGSSRRNSTSASPAPAHQTASPTAPEEQHHPPRPPPISRTETGQPPLLSPLAMPSTDAEQEPAFIRRQPSVGTTSRPASAAARASPSPVPPAHAGSGSGAPSPAILEGLPSSAAGAAAAAAAVVDRAGPPPLSRRGTSTFQPRYVVGPSVAGAAAAPGVVGGVQVKTRDFAAAIVPAAPSPARRRSTDMGAVRPNNTPPQQQPVKSGLSLALPQSMKARQDMAASGLTGDDDSVLGKDYIVVEKRNVEVNALADELAAQPRRTNTLSRRNSKGFLSRQLSNMSPAYQMGGDMAGVSPSPPSPAAPYPPTSGAAQTNIAPTGAASVAYEHPPFAYSRPPLATYGSSPRSRGISYGSSPGRNTAGAAVAASPLAIVGTSSAAIAKALNMASLKLFGSPTENIWLRKKGHRVPVPRTVASDALDPTEERLLASLEDLAQKATVIADFAVSKFFLMTPQGQADLRASLASPFFSNSPLQRRTSSASERPPTSPLGAAAGQFPPASPGKEAAQAGLDPVKLELLPGETLVLYLKALAFLDKALGLAREFWTHRGQMGQGATADFNDYVQWFRSRFNECFEKAEYAKSRLVGDIPDSAMLAEKLIFDRALEMSRAAAVSELMGENPSDCEIAYDTALWMLFAILDPTMQEGEPVEEEDRVTVQNFVKSIQGRLDALKRKMRTSATQPR